MSARIIEPCGDSLNDERIEAPENVRAWGIWSRYTDGLGRAVEVRADVIARILDSMAAPDAASRSAPRRTYVMRRGEASLHRFVEAGASAAWHIVDGGKTVAEAAAERDTLHVPGDLQEGIYELWPRNATDRNLATANLIVAPERSYQGPAGKPPRSWVISVQLYGLRSHRNWGHGDFGDVITLLECAARCGAGGVGLNPLHVLFDDRAGHISPYSPNSRRFLEPLYIDVEQIDEFPGVKALHLEGEIARLRAGQQVDYPRVRAAKHRALRACFETFRDGANHRRRQDFESFRAECGKALRRFASFETLRRRFAEPWWYWPEKWRVPNDTALASLYAEAGEEIEYHEYVQWIAHRQLDACNDKARQLNLPVGLYVDLAVGFVPDGADAWANQTTILRGLSVGAPPDLMNLQGQNWGLTTFSPAGLAEASFGPLCETLASNMRGAGAVRIDHVLGFNRLFVVPEGMAASNGTYLDFPVEAMFAVIALQSHRYRCIVVGEDLGTVPEGLRELLGKWGLWSYRVMQFERDWNGRFHPPPHYDRDALVTFTTHDLPTFVGWWRGHDLEVRRQVGHGTVETDSDRERSRASLSEAIGAPAGADGDFVAVARFLAATPSHLVAISLEDITGSTEQPNFPGWIDEYPNWRIRSRIMIEDLASELRLGEIAAVMRAAGRS
jgi:4-alpha-glucanotransferase